MPTIVPRDPEHFVETAKRLLRLAGDQPHRVRVVTAGPHSFDVDDELAAALAADGEPEAVEPPKPSPSTKGGVSRPGKVS